MTKLDPDNTTATLPRRVGVREFRGNLTGFLRQARQGASFLVTSHDEIVAEIRPPSATERPPRRPGALRGKIRMAPDFDTLPPDVLDAMEDGPMENGPMDDGHG
jgi:antitoxin (DNA-binding transcriptional repressor) of toxin-antitoxin stability system